MPDETNTPEGASLDEAATDFLDPVAPEGGDGLDFQEALDKRFAEAFGEDSGGENEKPPEEPAQEPTQEEKPAEEPAQEDQGDEWWKEAKAGEAFAKIKAEAKEARSEIEQLKSKLEAYEGVAPDEIPNLRKRLEEQEAKIAAVDLEQTEAYRTKIREPLSKLAQQAEEIGGDELIEALSENDPRVRNERVSTVLESLDALSARKVERLTDELDRLTELQTEMRSNAQEALKEMKAAEERQVAERTAQQKEVYQRETDKVWGALEGKLPKDLLDSREAEKALELTKKADLAQSSPTSQAFATASMNLLPLMAKALKDREARVAELEQTVSRLEGSSPRPPSGASPALPSGDSGEEKGFLDSLEARFQEAGL